MEQKYTEADMEAVYIVAIESLRAILSCIGADRGDGIFNSREEFMTELERYSGKIIGEVERLKEKTQKFEASAKALQADNISLLRDMRNSQIRRISELESTILSNHTTAK